MTLLFTDIEGSTRHVLRLGASYPELVARHREIVLDAVGPNRGQLVDAQHDTLFVAFASAQDAILGAVGAQQALATELWPDDEPIRVRMGLHTGEPERTADGYTGLDVHRAARLCSAAHGGQIVMSQTTRALVGRALPEGISVRDLGHHVLKDLPRPEHLIQLVVSALPSEFPPPRTLGAPAGLPVQRQPLIGRDMLLDRCVRLVLDERVRLLTLTGTGGTGKTSLAVQLAAALLPHFEDGVQYVPLAPVTDAALVERTIARALGVQERGAQPMLDSLIDALSGRQSLLVLDNFEHVQPAAPVVAALLAGCPALCIVVTSRELLHLSQEYDINVPPLPLPPPDGATFEQYAASDAVRLFVTRAQAVRNSFALTEENAPAVTEICRRLDGLPLALELAAARIRLLPPKALLSRLDRRLPILTDGPRDLPARQRTLRDTIGWSYGLLGDADRRVFRQLGVFVGGWTLEALQAVTADASAAESPAPAAGRPTDTGDPFDAITALVDKSLVRQSTVEGEPRYSLLETIREFAAEQLDLHDETFAARARLTEYLLALAEAADPELLTAEQVGWLDRLERELGNLSVAFTWCAAAHAQGRQTPGGSPAGLAGLRLAGALHWFWWLGGHVSEGRRWLSEALSWELGDEAQPARARALYAAGTLAMIQGAYDEAHALLDQGYELALSLGDRMTAGRSLSYRGIIETYFYETDRLDRDAAWRTSDVSAQLLEATTDRWGQALAVSQLGAHARRVGAFDEAERLLLRASAMARDIGERYLLGSCVPKLGNLYYDVQRYDDAEPLFLEALAAFRELREDWWTARCLQYLALTAGGRQEYLRAALLIGCADAILERGASRRNPREESHYLRLRGELVQELGEATFDDAYARGRQTVLDEMLRYVHEERARVPT
ncbi:MAG: tetratricopeptide repeat protein [Chloroflexi bacterium]|nr:tetratricopeptide repeat protein [Chloroflexota bacterium]